MDSQFFETMGFLLAIVLALVILAKFFNAVSYLEPICKATESLAASRTTQPPSQPPAAPGLGQPARASQS